MVAPLYSLKMQKFDPHAFITETCVSIWNNGKNGRQLIIIIIKVKFLNSLLFQVMK